MAWFSSSPLTINETLREGVARPATVPEPVVEFVNQRRAHADGHSGPIGGCEVRLVMVALARHTLQWEGGGRSCVQGMQLHVVVMATFEHPAVVAAMHELRVCSV